MANNESPRNPVAELGSALMSRFGLAPCVDVGALVNRTAKDPAGFISGLNVRIGEYYDIKPAITVYDAALGTLGFVEEISRTNPKQEWLRTIERAAAVRQILIDNAEEKSRSGSRELPLQVELVLVVSGASGTASLDPLRTVLTTIARETGYLRLIGLSILDLEQQTGFPEDVLRRAFAWLLKDTRKWFQRKPSPQISGSWRSAAEPLRMQLRDYRLAGVREFNCDASTWLNLVHGHNGSGKSSVAEAVELLLTNRIQRLDDGGEKNYFMVVRHRRPGVRDADLLKETPAEVALLTGGQVKALVRIENGSLTREGEQPQANVQANSFRIDQVFMDKLIRTQAAGRAALFLNAFSPGDAELLADLQKLRAAVDTAWMSLPEHVRKRAEQGAGDVAQTLAVRPSLTEEEMADIIVRELGSLVPLPVAGNVESGPPPQAVELSRAALEALLPAGQSDMSRLAQLQPGLGDAMQALLQVRDRSSIAQAASQFQSNLTSLIGSLPLLLADLKTAQRIFQEFRSWSASGRTARGASFEADLRQWLDLQALADVTAKYADMATTVEAAKTNGWKPDSRDAFLLAVQQGAVSRAAELSEELNSARARVEAWLQRSDTDQTSRSASEPGKIRRWLSPPEVEALNRIGQVLVSTKSLDLGVRFNRALAQDQEATLPDGAIGRSGGLDQAIRETAEVIAACDRLQQSSAGQTSVDLLQRITSILETARRLSSLSKELPKSFFLKLAGNDERERDDLGAAFNELLALMTPARWAYRNIGITAGLTGGDPAIGLQTSEGARADLLFNTAELNAFAIVLFLLLAPRLPNALRVLILDDPLQNMDELTVVTLARALAKLQPPVYPKDWQILAFFHGENNVEVIREEAPCHVYHLPWQQSADCAELQRLNESADVRDTGPASWQRLTPQLIAPA